MTLTAARGRGKSAALGLSLASAVAFGYVIRLEKKLNSSLKLALCAYWCSKI